MSDPAPRPTTARPEPRSPTLADLLAVVAGVAVVAWLPWGNWPEFVRSGGPADWVAAPGAWAMVSEAFGKACLAMVPVVLVRRAQFGGRMRPGEFLAACGGLYWLTWGVETRLFLAWMARRTGEAPAMMTIPAADYRQWRELVTWPRTLGMTTLAVAALVAIVVGRRRWPAWIVAAASMLAWIGLQEGGLPLLRDRISRHVLAPLDQAGHPILAEAIDAFTTAFPRLLLYAWPSVVAALGPRGEGRRRTWVQWASLGLAASAFVAEILIRVLIDFSGIRIGNPAALVWMDLGLQALALALAIGISVALSRMDPPWSQSRGLGYDGNHLPPLPPEA